MGSTVTDNNPIACIMIIVCQKGYKAFSRLIFSRSKSLNGLFESISLQQKSTNFFLKFVSKSKICCRNSRISTFDCRYDSDRNSDWISFDRCIKILLRFDYSVRSATTGSFFAALRAGITPEISVRRTLSVTSSTACPGSSIAMFGIPIRSLTMALAINEMP